MRARFAAALLMSTLRSQSDLTFPCLSDGFRIGFGPVCKSLDALGLFRDYLATSPPVSRPAPAFVESRRWRP
jgi:hypothetical protein